MYKFLTILYITQYNYYYVRSIILQEELLFFVSCYTQAKCVSIGELIVISLGQSSVGF